MLRRIQSPAAAVTSTATRHVSPSLSTAVISPCSLQFRLVHSTSILSSPKKKAKDENLKEKLTSRIDEEGGTAATVHIPTPRLQVPTRQSHLRLAETRSRSDKREDDPAFISSKEQAIKHNAFNLVMKLLYGKVADVGVIEGAHRILGTPSKEVCKKLGVVLDKHEGTNAPTLLSEQQKKALNGSLTLEESGLFAKAFIQQQKELWRAYDTALARARWEKECENEANNEEEKKEGRNRSKSASRSRNSETINSKEADREDDVDALMAEAFKDYRGITSDSVNGSGGVRNESGTKKCAPSDLIARLYAKRTAQQRYTDGRRVDTSVLESCDLDQSPAQRSAKAKKRLIELYTPAPIYAHALDGCFVGNYLSFTDMLTNSGAYFTRGPSAVEDLYIAAQLASTQSKTLPPHRLTAMREQFMRNMPASRYLFSPPGMLVRGYTAAVDSQGNRVMVLEPLERWIQRCREDVLNFERFCLAKVSANSLRNLNTRVSTMLKTGKTTGANTSSVSTITHPTRGVDCILIMDLFLMFRGMPTGATPNKGPRCQLALAGPQEVAKKVTAHFEHARLARLGSLPSVTSIQRALGTTAITLRPADTLDEIIKEVPTESQVEALGLVRPKASSANTEGDGVGDSMTSTKDEEALVVLEAYRQQAMFLRRHASAFSPSLQQRTSSKDMRLNRNKSKSGGHSSATSTSRYLTEEMAAITAARAARAEGLHAFDALARVVQRQK